MTDECGCTPYDFEKIVDEQPTIENGYSESLEKHDKQIKENMLKDVIAIVESIKIIKWHWKESFSNERVYEEFVDYDKLIDRLEHIADIKPNVSLGQMTNEDIYEQTREDERDL